ncbi:ABC transporter permease subunit [Pseudomonas sp. GX19020]|nr:ABC transporter permease subunit [Pseudomonas sp. GX19020]
MRLVDVLLSVPTLMIALAIIAVLGFGTVNLAIAVGIGSVASFARVMRGEILRLRAAEWVEASAFCGTAQWRLVLIRLLPNAFGPIAVLATIEAGCRNERV